jgi:hypothetical protein
LVLVLFFYLFFMNKGLLIGIIVVLVIGGIGAFLVMGQKSSNTENTQTQDQNSATMQADTDSGMMAEGPKSLRDLMGVTSNQTCTFTDADGQNSGTVYSANGKMRGDFSGTAGSTTTVSHMISDASTIYVWMDGSAQGFKGDIEALSKFSADSSGSGSKSVDPDKKVDYSCSAWTADESKFALPGIEFVDFSSMMMVPSGVPSANSGDGMMDMKATQCAACNNLPADAAAQCRQALSC